MPSYNLIKGSVFADNQSIKTDKNTTSEKIRGIMFPLIGAIFLYDKIILQLNKEQSFSYLIFTTIMYGILFIAIVYLIYHNWIKILWTNKLPIENLSELTISKDEDSPLNVDIELKGKFSIIDITFRETENDYQEFITYLKKHEIKFSHIEVETHEGIGHVIWAVIERRGLPELTAVMRAFNPGAEFTVANIRSSENISTLQERKLTKNKKHPLTLVIMP